jgi:hypothetical protein
VLAANTLLLLLQKNYKSLVVSHGKKYFLLSLKRPSFYSFSEEEEEC